MNNTVTWLHISDTHFCYAKNGWDSEEIFVSFFSDLKKMESDYKLCPDLIFFTGDVAFGHIDNSKGLSLKDQYKEAKEFLEKIRKIFSKEIPMENIFIVPGNHDINRSLIIEPKVLWLENLRNNKQKNGKDRINKSIKENDREWKAFMEHLKDYKSFLEDINYQHLLQDPDRLVYSTKRDVNGFEVGIAGLNSAWSSCGNEDKAKLWLGSYQISEARNNLRDIKLSIIISHHPPNWFTEYEDQSINQMIENGFKFYLYGHEHEEWVSPRGNHIHIASGALYNGSEEKNGYNFVKLYPYENRGEVFLRRYDKNHYTWIPNIIGGETNNDGIWPLKNLNISVNTVESKGESYTNVDNVEEFNVQRIGKIKKEEITTTTAETSNLNPIISFWNNIKNVPIDENSLINFIELINNLLYKPINITPMKYYDPMDINIINIINKQVSQVPIEGKTPSFQELKQVSQVPIEGKTPSLQELKTQEQVNNHFIPLPRVTDRVEHWISSRKDLLFLGHQFCGKTSLLTYLIYECARLDDNLQPIRIEPPKDISIENVPVSVSRLLQLFNQDNVFQHSKRPVLIIENIHVPSHFEIAKMLMNYKGRIWRIWATARPIELRKLTDWERDKELGKNLDIINDACDLLKDSDIEYIFEQ